VALVQGLRLADREGMSLRLRVATALLCFFLVVGRGSVFAGPEDPENYDFAEGGIISIPDKAIIEGSSAYGGLQPDYRIDLSAPEFQPLFNKARSLRNTLSMNRNSRIKALVRYLKDKVLVEDSYYDRQYRETMKKHRLQGKDVPLACYVKIGSGVCRERALLMHFALREMGIENFHVYASIRVDFGSGKPLIEDHAFNLIEEGGEYWIVDAYSNRFNAYRFRDFFDPQGVNPKSFALGFQRKSSLKDYSMNSVCRILKVYEFPRVWVPKGKTMGRISLKAAKYDSSCFEASL
jgi:hypothetical protein